MSQETLPILADKHYRRASAFTPDSLLREGRRQLGTTGEPVPRVCMLDPDGDVVRRLRAQGRARRHAGWACYHTALYVFEEDGSTLGVVGCAVGAPFAVLVAEQLFASGCRHLISVTSAGQLAEIGDPPYFVLIDRARRDEGTSYHYLEPGAYSEIPAQMLASLDGAFAGDGPAVVRGGAWTTDAPFRETQAAIAANRDRGLLAVEMEAAALYAFARARERSVVCFAHVTNRMGTVEGDFEKGEEDGVAATLRVVRCAAAALAA